LSELAQVRRTLSQLKPEVLINLAAGRGYLKSLRDSLFFRACGIGTVIGTPLRRRELRVEQMPDGLFEPESQRLALRLGSLGTVNLADRRLWDLRLTPAERNQAAEFLPRGQKNYLAVSVGTKLPVKDWEEGNWIKLLSLLTKQIPDSVLILLGAADESERSTRLGQIWTGGHINLCGKTSPRCSAAILEQCRLFIGHDSGPMHLAAATGIPTLGLFSWINPPGQWFPGHRSWNTIKILYPPLPVGGWKTELQMKQGPLEGIRLLQPDFVFESAMKLLESFSTEQSVPEGESKLIASTQH
jgi:ADP-heptose:LPS heptosyltransferase